MKGQLFPYKDENPSSKFPIVTVLLIFINIAVFIWTLPILFGNEETANAFFSQYGFVPAQFSIIAIITSMFLHGGIDHIAGNMWYLWLFGDNVEDRFGRIKYVIFYLAAGLFASLVHYISDPFSAIPAIGASGAISGVLGAYAAIFPKVKVKTFVPALYQTFELPAVFMIGFWFILQIIFGTVSFLGAEGSGIAFFAHIGGFVFGYMIGKVYNKKLWEKLLSRK